MIDKPKIRPVEVIQTQTDTGPSFILRDPLNLSASVISAPATVVWLLQFFDGNNTRVRLMEIFQEQIGATLAPDQLDSLIEGLDSALLLDGGRYAALCQAFRDSPTRPMSHAGQCYAADAATFREQIDGFYLAPKGPGERPSPHSHDANRTDSTPVSLLVAPHIDLRSGGPCFAKAYHALAQGPRPDTVVILGTGHAGLDHFFAATLKDFETPLGLIQTDKDFLRRLAERWGDELFEGEFLHKGEHTIEFQALFLKHLYGDAPVRIVPILCSYSWQHIVTDQATDGRQRIEDFAQALGETIAEAPGQVCVIASVDLAHIGPMYGDDKPVGPDDLSGNAQADREMLEQLSNWDADGFLKTIVEEKDKRNICGFPCLYTALQALPRRCGSVLSYDYTAMDSNGSYVSFAAMRF